MQEQKIRLEMTDAAILNLPMWINATIQIRLYWLKIAPQVKNVAAKMLPKWLHWTKTVVGHRMSP